MCHLPYYVKAYLISTGVVFGLVAVAHVLRVIQEGAGPLTNPWCILSSALSVGFCVWAWRLLRARQRK